MAAGSGSGCLHNMVEAINVLYLHKLLPSEITINMVDYYYLS